MNDRFFLPYEKISINGSVEKESGEDYEGLLTVEIIGLDEKTVEVIDGDFSFEYEIGGSVEPRDYSLRLVVEERNFEDKIINYGSESDNLEIRRKATSIDIQGDEEVVPFFEYFFVVDLLDQVGEDFDNETIVVKLMNPLGDIIFQDEVLSGERVYYNFSGDSMKGGWNIKGYYENIVAVKPVYVDINKEVKSYLVGNVLYFENLGNVPYEGIVDFVLDNGTFNEIVYVNISVGVGKIYEYPIYYVGEYNFTLEGESYGLVSLTGYSVLGEINFDRNSYFVAGGILVFLFLVWFFVFKKKIFRKIGKKRKGKISEEPATSSNIRSKTHPSRHGVADQLVRNQGNEIKGQEEQKKKKLVVQEKKEEKKPVVRKNYILFLESSVGVINFEGIVEKYGFKLNKVEDNLGYVLFFNSSEANPELKLYNLSKAIMKFSDVKGAKSSIVINRGLFENKLTLLKKFALLNRKLLKYAGGKILMTKKFFDSLRICVQKEVKKVRVMERELEVCIV